jgi:hypothetical protein
LASLGIEPDDPYGVTSQYNNRINTANASLTPGSDYSSAFSPTVLDDVLSSARSGQRNKYNTAFNTQVSPYYAEDMFNSKADDPILSSILDQQYNDTLTQLQAARDRGGASSNVYDRAVNDLGTAKFTANSDLQNIGKGILQTDIGDVNQRRQTSLDSAANWDFGSVYDPTQEANRVKSFATDEFGNLEGDIRGAVGGKQYFDVNSLLGGASAKVGNQTTPTTSGSGALFDTFQNEATRNATAAKQNEGIF